MKRRTAAWAMAAAGALGASVAGAADDGFASLFDGKTLTGWKASENPTAFSIDNGTIKCHGPRAHLFYAGPEHGAVWKNFHFKAEVKTTPGSNSGIFFHTSFQAGGWPEQGYEAQVANTHSDPIRTASIYKLVKVDPSPAKDNEWFTYEILVIGKQIITRINGATIVDYTEPEDPDGPPRRRLSRGTFALQAHDPGSTCWFRNLQVKALPDDAKPLPPAPAPSAPAAPAPAATK